MHMAITDDSIGNGIITEAHPSIPQIQALVIVLSTAGNEVI